MSFRDWYVRNQDAITWFLIGLLTWGGIDQLVRGHYGWAILDFAMVYLNYKTNSIRLQ